jgi:hypothetical protein
MRWTDLTLRPDVPAMQTWHEVVAVAGFQQSEISAASNCG